MKSNEIKNFGILGWPVGHSLSPHMFRAAFDKAGFPDYNYIPIPVQAGRLMLAVDGLKWLDFRGCNVTIPHKTSVMKFLDAIDADAIIVGAVNTIVNDGGILTGYNTDVTGFISALTEANFMPEDCHAVVLGAGGAARAVLWGLCKRKAEYITVAARNGEKAAKLAHDFASYAGVEGMDWTSEEFNEAIQTADILIDEMPPVDLSLLPEGALVYDIIYTPAKTKLLQKAEELGYPTLNGLSMLLLQGKESYRLYTGELPNEEVMLKALKEELGL